MLKKSLGLIECAGLASAIEAADTAVKSANVELVGYELAMGGGWTTVKVLGDVGAVKAAVESAKVAASNVGDVVATQVIARPAESLDALVINKRTLGSMPGARADVKGNSPLSASYVPPAPKEAPKAEPEAPVAEPVLDSEPEPVAEDAKPEAVEVADEQQAPEASEPAETTAVEVVEPTEAAEPKLAHKPKAKPKSKGKASGKSKGKGGKKAE